MALQNIHILFAVLIIFLMLTPMLFAIHIASGMKKTDSPQTTMKKLYAIRLLIGR